MKIYDRVTRAKYKPRFLCEVCKVAFSSRHNRLPAHHDLPICIYIALRDDVTSLIILHANRERMQTSSQIFLLTCPPCTITIYRARFVRCALCFSYILHVWTYTSISEYVHHIVYERSGSLGVCGCSVWVRVWNSFLSMRKCTYRFCKHICLFSEAERKRMRQRLHEIGILAGWIWTAIKPHVPGIYFCAEGSHNQHMEVRKRNDIIFHMYR